jgi:RimJ/RimL family protein N-acetyltransferase
MRIWCTDSRASAQPLLQTAAPTKARARAWLAIMRTMSDTASFSVIEPLRNGRQIEIRAMRPSDRDALLAAADRTSDQSLYRRFFGVRRTFSEQEVSAFVNVDFVDEVALVAVIRESGRDRVAGGARYIVVRPGTAEVAFTVVDEFQRQGLASTLLRHLVVLARAAGIGEFIAEVLPDNIAMLKVLERSGLTQQRTRESGVVHVTLQLR